MKIPNEAEMPPEKFEPAQIRAFLTNLFKDILPSLEVSIKEMEDGLVLIEDEVHKCSIWKYPSGGWGYFIEFKYDKSLWRGNNRAFLGPLALFEQLISIYAEIAVKNWLLTNYAVVA